MSPVSSQQLAPLKAHSHWSQVYWTLTTGKATSLGDSEWAIHRRPERTSQTSTELRHLEALDQEVRQARLVARYYVRQGLPTVTASTWASASLWTTLWTTLSAGLENPPITSMTLSAGRPAECPQALERRHLE